MWPHCCPDFTRKPFTINTEIILQNKESVINEFNDYAYQYKKAARIIADNLVTTHRISKLDTHFFSIAFLYRHSLELILKSIGLKYIVTVEEQKNFLKDTFHNLSSLFLTIKNFVGDKEAYTWLEAYFADIDSLDKESDSFRYPFSIKFERVGDNKRYYIQPFIDKQTHIDLVSFVNKMEIAFYILECIYKENNDIEEHYKEYSATFLEEGGDYHLQSVIGYSYTVNEYYSYIRGYIESAEVLYTKLKKNRDLKSVVFNPMCYLYRNGLELSMKEILFKECSYDFQKAAGLLKDCSHSLLKIWRYIKQDIIQHSNATEDDNTLENVEKYLKQLHNFDGAADKFRYPTNKYLEKHFKNPKKLDVQNIYEFFEEITNFFSGASSMMSAQNEYIAEMQAEMEAEYLSEMRSYYSDGY